MVLEKDLEMQNFYEDLGLQVWSWRISRGMTQQQLADACGVSRSRISLIDLFVLPSSTMESASMCSSLLILYHSTGLVSSWQ